MGARGHAHAPAVAEEEPDDTPVTISAPMGRARLVIQCSILAVVLFLGGYILLFLDRHNDERYIGAADYKKDSAVATQLHERDERDATRRMDAQDKKLDEIASDVKQLLRESRPGK